MEADLYTFLSTDEEAFKNKQLWMQVDCSRRRISMLAGIPGQLKIIFVLRTKGVLQHLKCRRLGVSYNAAVIERLMAEDYVSMAN